MRATTLYEQLGIVIPGAVLIVGILFYFPPLGELIGEGGIEFGGLGVLLLLSYAAGHLLGAIGNIIEAVLWKVVGGMPSNWIVGSTPTLLSTPQLNALERKVRARFGSDFTLKKIAVRDWFPITRQIYADVKASGRSDRIDAFNGNYGLNRGLCAAFFVLAFVSLSLPPHSINAAVLLFGLSAIYLYRMYRFGVHYARELYVQYLSIDTTSAKPSEGGLSS